MVNQLVINLFQLLIMYLCCLTSNTAALLYFTASCYRSSSKKPVNGYSFKPLKCSLVTGMISSDISLTGYSVTCGVVTLTIPK